MSIEAARKSLIRNKPTNVPSASALAKIHGTSTTQVTHLLKQLGYLRSTDNTGWYLYGLTNSTPTPAPAFSVTQEKLQEYLTVAEKYSKEELQAKVRGYLKDDKPLSAISILLALISRDKPEFFPYEAK